eukprot:3528238-Pyramimonas_sp.AAC.1
MVTSAENAQFTLHTAHGGLTAALQESGYAHNRGKSSISPPFIGRGSHARAAALFGATVKVEGQAQFGNTALGIQTAINGG